MVVLNRIYTRTGDDGTTALGSGDRRKKYDLRVDAYGTLDEVNAALGIVRLHTSGDPLDAALAHIQNDLFDLGADLCVPETDPPQDPAPLRATPAQTERLEGWIDQITAGLPELKSFVLPGGTELNSSLHIARTVCRRAERRIVARSFFWSVPPARNSATSASRRPRSESPRQCSRLPFLKSV